MKTFLIFILLAMVSVSCGTDGLKKTGTKLTFKNLNTDEFRNSIGKIEPYSYTLILENGTAKKANLTSFDNGGEWLKARLVNNNSAIELYGISPNVDGKTEYGYSITAEKKDEQNANGSFSITVYPN